MAGTPADSRANPPGGGWTSAVVTAAQGVSGQIGLLLGAVMIAVAAMLLSSP